MERGGGLQGRAMEDWSLFHRRAAAAGNALSLCRSREADSVFWSHVPAARSQRLYRPDQ